MAATLAANTVWLTVEEACYLSGWSYDQMLEIIDEGGVDLKDDEQVLIDKESLGEFQEAVAEYENVWLPYLREHRAEIG